MLEKGVATLGLLMLLARPASAEIIDRILAVVSGQIITKSDVDAARTFGLIDPQPVDSQTADEAALQSLIDRLLMLNEMRRVAPREPATAAVDAQLARIRGRFASAAALEHALAASGIGEPVLRAYAEDDLSLAAYLDERFTSAAQPTDQEVLQAGEANRQKLASERRQALIAAWVAELRRRAEISILQ